MSEQITHLAVADDVRLLAMASPRICDDFKQAVSLHHDKMRLGAVTRATETFVPALVRTLRDRSPKAQANDQAKLAFCLGTFAHRAADRMMKPIFGAQTADGKYSRKDISIYHDVFLFDRIYGRGAKQPYAPDALSPVGAFGASASLDAKVVEEYFRVLFQRALLSAHTFIPDESNPEKWLDNVFDVVQEMVLDVGRYHKALTQPDRQLIARA